MKTLPRHRFAHLPTPVEPMPRLSKFMGGPSLLVKRDDQTGLAFGGNKTRKLEFLLAEAQVHGARTLITGGAAQSNHCRQTAAAAARFGFDCILVLVDVGAPGKDTTQEEEDSHFTPASMPSGNLVLDHLLGAEIVWTLPEERDKAMLRTFQTAEDEGRRPFLIPYGGSNPIGAAAYVYAVEELLEQNVHPDWIVFASSSGGTQAGLVLGARLFGFKGNVLGISIEHSSEVMRESVARLASATAGHLGEPIAFSAEEILVNSDYLGGGYGVMAEPEKLAIHLFARLEGLLLDPVYTGRAAAGMIDLIRSEFFSPEQSVLFWHTGGTPALFTERYSDVI